MVGEVLTVGCRLGGWDMARLNGDRVLTEWVDDAKPRGKARPVVVKCSKPRRGRGKPMMHAKRLAVAVGAVGTGLLGLSVAHCTESIGLLTGSHWALAGLLAVGIDAGMVVAELAELASHGTKAEAAVRPWARGYIVVAVLLSVLLNGYAFGLHATGGMVWAAWLLGAVIPGLVYCLGRVAGGLWLAE